MGMTQQSVGNTASKSHDRAPSSELGTHSNLEHYREWLSLNKRAGRLLNVIASLVDSKKMPNGVQVPEATAVYLGEPFGSRTNSTEVQGLVTALLKRGLVTSEKILVDTGKNIQKVRHLKLANSALQLIDLSHSQGTVK
jgi:hypothetical protein